MVFIPSCERCKNDCENGMDCSQRAKEFCGEPMVSYYCPINGGAYLLSLETARKCGFYGRTFEETGITGNYGEYQHIVEFLSTQVAPVTFKEDTHEKQITFEVKMPKYQVFQTTYANYSPNGTGYSGFRVIGYSTKIIITEDKMTFYVDDDVVDEIYNRFNRDGFGNHFRVICKHIK